MTSLTFETYFNSIEGSYEKADAHCDDTRLLLSKLLISRARMSKFLKALIMQNLKAKLEKLNFIPENEHLAMKKQNSI